MFFVTLFIIYCLQQQQQQLKPPVGNVEWAGQGPTPNQSHDTVRKSPQNPDATDYRGPPPYHHLSNGNPPAQVILFIKRSYACL